MRLAVLASGSGTNLQALLDVIEADDTFPGAIVVVASDQRDAMALKRADRAGIANVSVAVEDFDNRAEWEEQLVSRLQDYAPEAIVLAGFMRIVSSTLLSAWPGRVINVHPSLLPAFRGANAVRDALEHGAKITGSTVHFVDEEVDHGPIIAQRSVAIESDDDEQSLHDRIKAVEHELLPQCVRWLCEGRLRVVGRHVHVVDGPGEGR